MTVVTRESSETRVRIELDRTDAASSAESGVPFLDHMLITLARYAGVSLRVSASGDLEHHVIEDVAIALGIAFSRFSPPASTRYGDRTIPMDDALVHVVLDTGGRSYYRGRLPSSLYDHFMRSFAENARITLHIRLLRGSDRHHVVEAAFKALGLALRDALQESGTVFSTKGSVSLGER